MEGGLFHEEPRRSGSIHVAMIIRLNATGNPQFRSRLLHNFEQMDRQFNWITSSITGSIHRDNPIRRGEINGLNLFLSTKKKEIMSCFSASYSNDPPII